MTPIARAFAAATLLAVGVSTPRAPATAEDGLVTYRALALDTALAAAQAAVEHCREQGYQVAVAVVDRGGNTQVLLRDRFAGPHTPKIAAGKAWTAVSFRQSTTELVGLARNGGPAAGLLGQPEVVLLGGGLMIQAGGSLVGGIGVSGAPGGDLDDACAQAGLDAIADTLLFAGD